MRDVVPIKRNFKTFICLFICSFTGTRACDVFREQERIRGIRRVDRAGTLVAGDAPKSRGEF